MRFTAHACRAIVAASVSAAPNDADKRIQTVRDKATDLASREADTRALLKYMQFGQLTGNVGCPSSRRGPA